MQRIVINELRSYAKHYQKRGMRVRTTTKNPDTVTGGPWHKAACAWDSKRKCYRYLLVKVGE